jgi:ribosome-associated protein
MEFSRESLLSSVSFKTSRSGGKGGQHVNKVSSKVELNFDFEGSELLDEDQKLRIRKKLAGKLTSTGMIQVISEEERSQYKNKERSLDKLIQLLKNALHQPKARKATKPKRSAIESRLEEKKKQALKKINRSNNFLD